MQLMPPQDSLFLVPESREQPMHVGGLHVFELPEGAGEDFVTSIYEQGLAVTDVAPIFRQIAKRSVRSGGQWSWEEDENLDLEHHLRHSALPHPHRVRELLALIGRLHGTLLDRTRPLWELHVVEGLEGNRFAIYYKVHHALVDGVTSMAVFTRNLAGDPETTVSMPYARWPSRPKEPGPGRLSSLLSAGRQAVREQVTFGPAMVRAARSALQEQSSALPRPAPTSMFNVAISGSRRFAADDWPLARLKAVGKAAGATVNDVVLAMSAGALRKYLLENDALPDAPLVAMNPVSLRKEDVAGDAPGNAVGIILCPLATDLVDPAARLSAIHESMVRSKELLRGLSQAQIAALSAIQSAPMGAAVLSAMFAPALSRLAPPPYNLVISNVPGPQEELFFSGARLQGIYPLSIPTHGQALNITVTSYHGQLQFGLTADRRAVPHVQRLLVHLEDSLAELERAVGV